MNTKKSQNQPIARQKGALQPEISLTCKSNIINKNVLDDDEIQGEEEMKQKALYDKEFKQFENYRSYLLQFQFLNATLKHKMKKQQQKLEIEFTDRLQQVRDVIEDNIALQTRILRERAINSLENVLAIEYKNYKEIFSKLDEFTEYATNLQEFLNGSVKKVYIDSGFSINIESVNAYINESSSLIQKIVEKHSDFFQEYPLITQALNEIIQETMVQIRAIKSVKAFLEDINSDQQTKLDEKVIFIQTQTNLKQHQLNQMKKAKEEYFRQECCSIDIKNNQQPIQEQSLLQEQPNCAQEDHINDDQDNLINQD